MTTSTTLKARLILCHYIKELNVNFIYLFIYLKQNKKTKKGEISLSFPMYCERSELNPIR
jgi:hypothetical protein